MLEKYKVEPCEFTCARKFLDALDETDSKYRGETWIYRGQNIDKELLPSAMRPCKIIDDYVSKWKPIRLQEAISDSESASQIEAVFQERFASLRQHDRHAELVDMTLDLHNNQLSRPEVEAKIEGLFRSRFRENFVTTVLHSVAERSLVVAFVGLADQAGLKVPQDNFSTVWNKPFPFRDQLTFGMLRDAPTANDEIDEYASIAFALARHHRVPTRLLDWTYRPLVAAYFAADYESESATESDGRILVWAVHEKSLPKPDLQVVKHRRSEIGFLKAQDGLFLYDVYADEKYWIFGQWAPFDYYFHTMAQNKKAYKFTLPHSRRDDLLDLLKQKGISRPMLMPSFDYVSTEIQRSRFNLMEYIDNKI